MLLFRRIQTQQLDVNTILDMFEEEEDMQLDTIYLTGPEGDDSDGYDGNDTEEALPGGISRNMLRVSLRRFSYLFQYYLICSWI